MDVHGTWTPENGPDYYDYNSYTSRFANNLAAISDPNDMVAATAWGDSRMAMAYAMFPVEDGGLTSTISLCPEMGMTAGQDANYNRHVGYVYMTALYDTLVDPSNNFPPTVSAGSNQTIVLPGTNSVTLAGTVSDDGQPGPGVTSTWSMWSGPAPATFANVSAPSTTATFTQVGTYVLRLQAGDSALVTVGSCQIIVNGPPNNAPIITMPAGITTAMPAASTAGAVALNASVSDDGISSPLTVTWSMVSGPVNGSVTFTDANAASTTAGFSRVGTYVLNLHAYDGNKTADANMTVKVTLDSRADFDGSANVDGSDFLAWQRNYNHGTAASGAPIVDANFSDPNYAKANGDANGDGKADGQDYLIWQQDYTFGH